MRYSPLIAPPYSIYKYSAFLAIMYSFSRFFLVGSFSRL